MITNVEIKDLPKPIDKILTFTDGEIDFKFTVTDNILLKYDYGYVCNVYKEFAQIIGIAVKGPLNRIDSKQVRLESEQFEKTRFNDEFFQAEIKKLIEVAKGKLL